MARDRRFVIAGVVAVAFLYYVNGVRWWRMIGIRESAVEKSDSSSIQTDESFMQTSIPYLPYLPVSSSLIPKDEPVDKIIEFEGTARAGQLAHQMIKGAFCGGALRGNHNRTLVNITFGCKDLYQSSGSGTGNFVAAFYGVRLAAYALGNIDVLLQCADAEETKRDLVLPWLTGFFPGVRHSIPFANRTNPTVQEACTHYNRISLGYKIPSMRYELRRMAIALVGIPDESHPSAKFAEAYLSSSNEQIPDGSTLQVAIKPLRQPLYNIELDDAVLHFRCGDLIASNHPSFGFIPFRSFSRHISPHVRSIGIVTQPFEATGMQQRPSERTPLKLDRCRLVVTEFAKHLQDHFPNARVTIRNNANETIALAFARMVMANQTVSPISSFSVIPVLSTFGTGYIRKPDYRKAPNQFLLHPDVEELLDNVFLIEEPVLMAAEVNKMWGENGTEVLDWFWS
jgi:hypothetical protein